jgi:hypothetical protein
MRVVFYSHISLVSDVFFLCFFLANASSSSRPPSIYFPPANDSSSEETLVVTLEDGQVFVEDMKGRRPREVLQMSLGDELTMVSKRNPASVPMLITEHEVSKVGDLGLASNCVEGRAMGFLEMLEQPERATPPLELLPVPAFVAPASDAGRKRSSDTSRRKSSAFAFELRDRLPKSLRRTPTATLVRPQPSTNSIFFDEDIEMRPPARAITAPRTVFRKNSMPNPPPPSSGFATPSPKPSPAVSPRASMGGSPVQKNWSGSLAKRVHRSKGTESNSPTLHASFEDFESDPDPGMLSILLVEDNHLNRQLAARLLTSIELPPWRG